MPRQLTITEGSATTFTIGLGVGESSFATSILTSNDVSVTPASISLSSSARSQELMVSAPADMNDVSEEGVFVSLDIPGEITSPSIRTHIVDIDVPNYVASNWNLTVPANGSATCDISLTDWPKAPDRISDPRNVGVTVIGDQAAHAVVSPTLLTFHSGDYNVPQTITVTRVDDTFFDQTLILLGPVADIPAAPTISVVPPYSELE